MTLSWARSSSTLFTLLLLMKAQGLWCYSDEKNPNNRDQRFTSLVSRWAWLYRRWYKGVSRAFRCCTALDDGYDRSTNAGVRVWPLVERSKVNHKTPFDNTPSSIVYIITGLIDRNVVEEWIVNPTTEQLGTKPVVWVVERGPMAWLHWLSSKEAFSLRLIWISGQCNIHHRLANL